MNDVCGSLGAGRLNPEPLHGLGSRGQSFVVRVDRYRLLTAGGHFHARFDAQVLGDAAHNHPQVARRRIAATVEHPVERLFAHLA